MKIYILLVSFLLNVHFLFGQKKINPKKPIESYPESQHDSYISTLNIPVELPLDSIKKYIDKGFSGKLFEMKNASFADIDRLNIEVWKDGDLEMKGKTSTIFTETTLKILINGKIEGNVLGFKINQKVKTDALVLVKLKTNLSISNQWDLESTTSLDGYQWIKEPKIKVGLFQIPVARMANQVISEQANQYTKNIDDLIIKQIDFKSQITTMWKLLQEPYASSAEYQLWSKFEPKKAFIKPLIFENNILKTNFLMETYMKVIQSKSKPSYSLVPLPAQEKIPSQQNGFDMDVRADISRAFLVKEAKKQMLGKTYSFRKRRKVKVEDLDIYGSNGKTAVALSLSGDINGNIYLLGDLAYHKKKDKLYFDNLDFDIDTKQNMLKLASWLFKGKFKKNIQKILDENIGYYMKMVRAEVQKNLSHFEPQKGMVMKGEVEELYVRKVIMGKDNILVFLPAKGKVKLNIFSFGE